MTGAPITLKKLAERVLSKGADLPLALMLEHLVPVAKLRQLARKHGLSPKGGFRLERAPANVLAPLLAEQREPDKLDEVLSLLLPADGKSKPDAGASPAPDTAAVLALRDAELARMRQELEWARESAVRAQGRATDLSQRLERAEHDLVLLRREVDRTEPPRERNDAPAGDEDLRRRLRDLEDEREGFVLADEALRRQLAHNQSRLRELEATVEELQAAAPRGKRRPKQPAVPAETGERPFRLPWFLPSFYKSLEGKERRAVERAFQAVLLFCTEGHAYPGLEVKQLGGQDTWSLRASLGLRIYFRQRPDGDIELIELGDREEQHTTLRRLKSK